LIQLDQAAMQRGPALPTSRLGLVVEGRKSMTSMEQAGDEPENRPPFPKLVALVIPNDELRISASETADAFAVCAGYK